MTKRIPALKARQQLGTLLDEVRYRGVEFIIERDGKPAAAVIPVETYARYQQLRAAAFTRVEALRKRLAQEIAAEDLEDLIDEAAGKVRQGT